MEAPDPLPAVAGGGWSARESILRRLPSSCTYDQLEEFRPDLLDVEAAREDFDDIRDWLPRSLEGFRRVTEVGRQRAFWAQAFRLDAASFAEFEWFRLVCAWRITMLVARECGLVEPDEVLAEAIERRQGIPFFFALEKSDIPRRSVYGWPSAMALKELVHEHGLWLAPPDIPDSARDPDGLLDPTYDPRDDRRLGAWCDLVELAARHLRLSSGTKAYPGMGDYGLRGVQNPLLARILWPTPRQLLAFEQRLVDEALSSLGGRAGARMVRKKLLAKYGFDAHEVKALVAAAGREAVARFGGQDVEHARAMLLLQLDDLQERAYQATDHRAELMVLKTKAVVLGVTKAEPEDATTSFGRAVATLVAEDRRTPALIEDRESA